MDSSRFKRAGDMPILQCGLYPLLLMVYCSLCMWSAANTIPPQTNCQSGFRQLSAKESVHKSKLLTMQFLAGLRYRVSSPTSVPLPSILLNFIQRSLYSQQPFKNFSPGTGCSFFPPSATPLERIGSDVATFLSPPFLLLYFRMRDGFFFPFVALRKEKKSLAIVAQVWFSQVPFWFELW